MIKAAEIIRPIRLKGLHEVTKFLPSNSKDHFIEVDLGFTVNPIYKQDKLCYFLTDNVYYQRLSIVDGKNNFIKDDARTIVIAGKPDESTMIKFDLEIYPGLPANAVDTAAVLLPFYPDTTTEFVIKDKELNNSFYHFSTMKIIYKNGGTSWLQLRHTGNYNGATLAGIFRKWHPEPVTIPADLSQSF